MRPLNEEKILATRLLCVKDECKRHNEREFNELSSQEIRTYNCRDFVCPSAVEKEKSEAVITSPSFFSSFNFLVKQLLPKMDEFVQAPRCLKLKKGTQVLLIASG
jgi:hypothetical protein